MKDNVNDLLRDRGRGDSRPLRGAPPRREEDAPPVPQKDRVMSVPSDIITRSQQLRDRGLVALPMTPPEDRSPLLSPDSLSETMSFLSSHHSDDFSLMEEEPYPYHPSPPSLSPPSSLPESSASSLSTPGLRATDIGYVPSEYEYDYPESPTR